MKAFRDRASQAIELLHAARREYEFSSAPRRVVQTISLGLAAEDLIECGWFFHIVASDEKAGWWKTLTSGPSPQGRGEQNGGGLMFVTMLSRQAPTARCDTLFTNQEWRSVYIAATRQPPPTNAPDLQVFLPLLARLGGYLNRKCDPPPGPKAIWIGLQRMRDFVLLHDALGPRHPS